MFKAPVFTVEGERGSERDLPASFFDGVVHQAAMWQAVKAYRANQRRGTAATKNRAAVRGGSRKPWRQKGTGRARQGTIRAPQWRGGGVVFGPGGENFRERIPKKLKGLARRSAFNARAEDGRIFLVEDFSMDAPKTKRVVALLESIGAEGNVLFLTNGVKADVHLSARNIPQVVVRPFGEESTYDVLWADTVLIEASALDRLPAEPAEEAAPTPAKTRARRSRGEPKAGPETAAEAATEPTATSAPATQPSDDLAGGPAAEDAEAQRPKRAARKKAQEPSEGEE